MKLFSAVSATFAALASVAWAAPERVGRGIANHGFKTMPLSARASKCNGDASLCDKKFSNVTFVGTHNSYATGSNVAAEQTWNVTQQLQAGVRLLQAQAHPSNSSSDSGIHLCHSSCKVLDGGSLESWLGEIKSWSDSNSDEVLTLLLVNSENISPAKFATAFKSSGIDSLVWQPSGDVGTKQGWPTLGSMIDSGKRIVSFLSAGADSSVPWLMAEFSSIWENPYDQESVPFNCSIDRSGKGTTPFQQMYLINHYKDQKIVGVLAPDKKDAPSINAKNQVLQDADACASGEGHGSYPNFILLDFVGEGDGQAWQEPFQAAAQMNGVSYSAPKVDPSSNSSSTKSSGSQSGAAVIRPCLLVAGASFALTATWSIAV